MTSAGGGQPSSAVFSTWEAPGELIRPPGHLKAAEGRSCSGGPTRPWPSSVQHHDERMDVSRATVARRKSGKQPNDQQLRGPMLKLSDTTTGDLMPVGLFIWL